LSGSFDSAAGSLREPATALRMTIQLRAAGQDDNPVKGGGGQECSRYTGPEPSAKIMKFSAGQITAGPSTPPSDSLCESDGCAREGRFFLIGMAEAVFFYESCELRFLGSHSAHRTRKGGAPVIRRDSDLIEMIGACRRAQRVGECLDAARWGLAF